MDKEVVVSQFSCSVVPDSFRSQGLQHARRPVHHQIPELTQTHVHHVSDAIHHLLFCRPLLLLPSIFPSIRVFANELVLCIRWPKQWSSSFGISPSNEYSGLMSFRIDWFDLLVVQFKSICSLVLSLPYSPILTSMHDYWIA